MQLTDKAYQSINADQRAAAAVAAMARADNPEVRRLWQTTPRFTGWMADPKFTERMRAFERMALRVALSIEQDAGEWLLYLAAIGHGPTPDAELSPESAERAAKRSLAAMSSAKSTWQAYTEACDRLGADADELLAAFGASLSQHARSAVSHPDTEINPLILDAMRELLAVVVGED